MMQFFMFGMWSCLYAYTPELYPTRARSTGAGFASVAGRVGAIISPIVIGMIKQDIGVSACSPWSGQLHHRCRPCVPARRRDAR